MSLEATHALSDLRSAVRRWKNQNARVGLVPTMGNLHEGHLALIDRIRASCDRVVASVFVNPTQFGPNEDFEAYPRTLDEDLSALDSRGVDLVWAPSVKTMYPSPDSFMVRVPKALSATLCGEYRPGHFDGVASVVLRLFLQVMPDTAIFGEKDFQQLLVLRQLVADYAMDIDIQALPTVREADGLAMSSRNQYLTDEQRARAPEFHAVLASLAEGLRKGQGWNDLQAVGLNRLKAAGFKPQYLEWRSAETLAAPRDGEPQRILAAAQLGSARLIDNVLV